MNFLQALWLSSLVLAVGAIAVMTGLVVARIASERRARARAAERRRNVALLLGDEPDREAPEGIRPASDPLTDLSIELIRLVRGEERTKFLASAARLGVPDRLRERLRHGRASTRLAAAEALGHFEDASSIDTLTAALSDANQQVRLTAALALAAQGHAPPAPELVAWLGLGRDEHSLLGVALLKEIARDHPEQISDLLLDPAIAPEVKAAAVEALSSTGNYAVAGTIADLAARAPAEAEILPRYLRALGEIGHPVGARAVAAHFGSPIAEVRAAAAEAAGRIGMIDAAGRLESMLADEAWPVRFQAGRALVRLGKSGLSRLESRARDEGLAGETAALTLAESGAASGS